MNKKKPKLLEVGSNCSGKSTFLRGGVILNPHHLSDEDAGFIGWEHLLAFKHSIPHINVNTYKTSC